MLFFFVIQDLHQNVLTVTFKKDYISPALCKLTTGDVDDGQAVAFFILHYVEDAQLVEKREIVLQPFQKKN